MDLMKIASSRAITVPRETSLAEVARLMRDNHVGDVVVTEQKAGRLAPVGILTDRDIVMATIAVGAPIEPLLAGDVMTAEVACISADASLIDAIALMKEKGIRRLPLINKDASLIGIVTLEDIMALLSRELTALAQVAERQKEMELRRRRTLSA